MDSAPIEMFASFQGGDSHHSATVGGKKKTPSTSSSSSSSSSSAHAAAATEEARKEKNRLKVRRHYYRKLDGLNALRIEVAQLESQLQKMSVQRQHRTSSQAILPFSTLRTHPMLNELMISTQKLIQEQEYLQHRRRQQLEDFAHLRKHFVAERDLYMTSPLAKMIIHPFTREECYRVRDQAIRDALSFASYRKSRRGHGLAGWLHECSSENGFFKFSLQKTFYNIQAETVQQLSWPLLSNPKVYEKLYSPCIEAKCVLVQQIDVHNIVMYQEWRTMDKSNEYIFMKSLFLVSLGETETGYILILRGLGEDRLKDRELFLPSVGSQAGLIVWHDVFSWCMYDRSGLYGQDTNILFSGIAPTVGQNSPFWTYEVFMLALRWEYAIIGSPRLLISSENENSKHHNHQIIR